MAYTAIDDPEAYFQVQLYTGDGAAKDFLAICSKNLGSDGG